MRNKPIKDGLLRVVQRLGADIVSRTPDPMLRGLVDALRPIDPGVELIRLGPDGDGGYLVPDDLAGIEFAFSPGVAAECGFESALAARGIRVYLADPSVDAPPEAHPLFEFDRKLVGALSSETCMTLDDWKRRKIPGHRGDLLLQMDIEGDEFEALLAASSELLAQFRIMIVEFHYLQELLNRPFFEIAAPVFRKVLQTHSVVHIHPNNCCGSVRIGRIEIPRVAEFTLYRNDRIKSRGPRTRFPHPLDRDNTRKRPLALADCWYR